MARVYTGNQDMTGAVVTATTQTASDNSTKLATTAYADAAGSAGGAIGQGIFSTAFVDVDVGGSRVTTAVLAGGAITTDPSGALFNTSATTTSSAELAALKYKHKDL